MKKDRHGHAGTGESQKHRSGRKKPDTVRSRYRIPFTQSSRAAEPWIRKVHARTSRAGGKVLCLDRVGVAGVEEVIELSHKVCV